VWSWGHGGLGIYAIVSDVHPSAEHRKVYLPPVPNLLVESMHCRVNMPVPGPMPEDIIMMPGPKLVN